MIKSIDPGLDMAALHAPTAEEIRELTARTTAAARARVEDAARALLVAKMQADDTTPWRELVEAYRASEPVRIEVEVVDDAGTPRVQVAFIERGFGIEGTAGRVHACVGELVRSLDVIEEERRRSQKDGVGGGRPSMDADIRQCLTRVMERHDEKKLMQQPISWIVDRVQTAWAELHAPDKPPPAGNTIRRVIELDLPEHPKVKKKKLKNPGS